jgi:5-methylthioadenosine/S-adenosylhomocysteine deaminase
VTEAPSETSPSRALVIAGGSVVDVPGRTVRRADILIEGATIVAVTEPGGAGRADARVIDVRGGLVLPGLVNAHTHSYSMLCRHVGGGLPLEPWMMYAWAYTVGRTREEVRLSALLHALEALHTGTTSILDHLGGSVETCDAALEAYDEIGLRAAVAPMVSDMSLPDTVGLPPGAWPSDSMRDAPELTPAQGALDATLELHEKWRDRSDRVRVFLGPSAPQRCSRPMLERCAQLSADLGIGVHTHLLESRPQAAMAPPSGGSWVGYLDAVGLLSHRLSAAHGVWLTPEELELVASSGATLVHNPWSNLTLGSGIAELPQWRRAGIRTALGTDGVNCGGSMDMVAALRLAVALHRPGEADPAAWENPWSILDLATSGGAGALGLPAGSISAGARADLSVFDGSGTEYATQEDVVASLVLSSTSHQARMVLVDGVVVVEDGRVTTVDEQALLEEARAVHQHLGERNAGPLTIARAQQETLTRVFRTAPANRALVPFRPGAGG